MKIIAYCDGACSKNGKKYAKGGIGIHFPDGEEYELSDISKKFKPKKYGFTDNKITNQRTELAAILETIKYIEKNFYLEKIQILIYSDSMYSVKTINLYHKKWKKIDDMKWIKPDGKPVKNVELISPLLQYFEDYDIELKWIKGHGNCKGNNIADNLARESIASQKNHQ